MTLAFLIRNPARVCPQVFLRTSACPCTLRPPVSFLLVSSWIYRFFFGLLFSQKKRLFPAVLREFYAVLFTEHHWLFCSSQHPWLFSYLQAVAEVLNLVPPPIICSSVPSMCVLIDGSVGFPALLLWFTTFLLVVCYLKFSSFPSPWSKLLGCSLTGLDQTRSLHPVSHF